ncbi:MAG: photosystem assembly BtpA [Phycisphaerales bacterium]|nr:photosystem assembly BtpA [Phycisphaerales bacterium]
MLHLPALPGSPLSKLDLKTITQLMLKDADTLTANGCHGLMLENFGDVPFYTTQVPAHTVAQLTAVAVAVRQRFGVPLGINCLRNDGCSAISIAHAANADYVRVNVVSGARVTDQGVIEGVAAPLLRLRQTLSASHIKILADVDVKHSAPLGVGVALEDEVDDVLERGLADGLVVSGAGTGKATDPAKAARVRKAAAKAPIFIGSGVTLDSVEAYLPHVTGVIVGTHFKEGGKVDRPVEGARVKALVQRVS